MINYQQALTGLFFVLGLFAPGQPAHAQETNKSGVGFYYFPEGNDNEPNSFEMSFEITDEQVEDAYFSQITDLKVEIEYQSLAKPQQSFFTSKAEPKSLKSIGNYLFGEVSLTGLKEGTNYRARIRFYAQKIGEDQIVEVGTVSDWYYTTTTASSTTAQKRAVQALENIHENRVGYTGVLKVDKRFQPLNSPFIPTL